MPLVHISLLKGKPPEYLRAIGDGVQQALVEAFKIPDDDRFQLIRQHEREELIYDANYLGIQRTDDLVIIHVVAGNWRDADQKKKLYQAIADNLADKPGLRREDVTVVLSGNERADWSFGHGLASYV